ncbi:MAG: Xaa-Pro peptidase family protein [Oscillospiraceae bacterium]|nr:Xaa-Pro peptidase family protein [Oscillospiraceae bacterium]
MSNINKIKQKLSQFNINAMLISSPSSRLYATGFSSSAGMLLVTNDDAWFIIDSRYFEAAGQAIKDANVILLPKNDRYENQVQALIAKNNLAAIGFEDGTVTYAVHKSWEAKYGVELIGAQKLLNELRNVKSRDELDCIIRAQRLSEQIFWEILPLINANMTEKDLAAEFIYRALKSGADKESFDPIVVSGPNSSLPHGVPGGNNIGNGFLTIDFGVRLDGWCSDTTRTVCVGQPDDEMVKVYETVLAAQLAGIAAVRAGINGAVVDAAARKVIEDAGFGEYFGHAFGHSIGLEVHETLSASPISKDILPAGAVISAEPGIYLPGRFGVRIEDTLYVTEDGCENITNLPKNLMVI